MDYNSVKFNFTHNLWGIPVVRMAVRKGIITKAQYQEITGEAYE